MYLSLGPLQFEHNTVVDHSTDSATVVLAAEGEALHNAWVGNGGSGLELQGLATHGHNLFYDNGGPPISGGIPDSTDLLEAPGFVSHLGDCGDRSPPWARQPPDRRGGIHCSSTTTAASPTSGRTGGLGGVGAARRGR